MQKRQRGTDEGGGNEQEQEEEDDDVAQLEKFSFSGRWTALHAVYSPNQSEMMAMATRDFLTMLGCPC